MSGVERVDGWRTSDGEFFDNEAAAQAHQDRVDFEVWCLNVINPSWSADTIAKAIWRSWHVSERRIEAAEE